MQTLNQEFVDKVKLKILNKEQESEIRKWIGSSLKIGKTRRNEIFNKIKNDEDIIPKKWPVDVIEVKTENENTLEITAWEVKTIDDLIKFHKIDLDVWEVVKFSSTLWDSRVGVRGEFKKKTELVDIKQIFEDLKTDLLAVAPKVAKIHNRQFESDRLLEVCAFDLHLGKLGWEQSDGQNYDLEIAERVFKDAIIDIVSKAKNFGEFDRIVFPIGNDYLTCDNSHNTTYASTPQSVDSRFPKIFKKGRELLVWAIDLLKEVAPVDVVYVVSNHDTDSMFHMSDAIECWYRNDENVNVDSVPHPRKYYRFGDVVIAFAHGDKIALNKFPTLATAEYKEWSMCNHREVHTGDKHHERAFIAEENSCIIRIIPSLSGNDTYHNFHGFIGAKQRGQGFIWDRKNGLEAIIYSKSEN